MSPSLPSRPAWPTICGGCTRDTAGPGCLDSPGAVTRPLAARPGFQTPGGPTGRMPVLRGDCARLAFPEKPGRPFHFRRYTVMDWTAESDPLEKLALGMICRQRDVHLGR